MIYARRGETLVNIFFDVDQTILAADGRLRPGVRELFAMLAGEGHSLFVWSGMGVRWDDVRRHRLDGFVRGVFAKPLHSHHDLITRLGITVQPDFVVDDYPEVVEAFGGVVVRPYLSSADGDSEMDRVYRVVASCARDGRSPDPSFTPRRR